ncbi:NFX1-type zinc finger-containing protein 1-like [Cloeon dipterum]|uniref:NFX1-type zinc finger-containing protein 1-like n=1 Tax=Cloeon dipterum TaxID=197152 RepID=UPI0032202E7D
MYNNVRFCDSNNVKENFISCNCHDKGSGLLKFCSPAGKNNPDQGKLLLPGSIVLLTCDNFNNYLIAIVKCKHIANWQISIDFCDGEFKNEGQKHRTYTMMECEVYFEPYKQVLGAIKDINPDDMLMPHYIIEAQVKKVNNLDRRRIFFDGPNGQSCLDSKRPDPRSELVALGVNFPQLCAIKNAVNSEIALIQGPPGTGKTYVALKITEIMIKNKEDFGIEGPILVLCKTNRALDQFMLGVLKFTTQILRFGGQSQCPELDSYNFNRLKGNSNARWYNASEMAVVGMTTTAAARNHMEIRHKLGCTNVIVEEAAQIFEAHVVASLSSKIKQMILIGDHQQLRPTVNNHELSKFYLDVSLFERLVKNGMVPNVLEVQHRMPPQISQLLCPIFYRNLQNGAEVFEKPLPKGLRKIVSFVHHGELETQENGGMSWINLHEARFLVGVCQHLLFQRDYSEKDITILTMYKGQMYEIKKIIRAIKAEKANKGEKVTPELEALTKVRVAVVDDFQGEECNIILLSLVRSNQQGQIGFVNTPNRVCVALSRAKIGLVIAGNIHTLARGSDMWRWIGWNLSSSGAVSDTLDLRCELHLDQIFKVRNGEEIKYRSPYGGCSKMCMMIMPCGHSCFAVCHAGTDDHGLCRQPCQRICQKCRKRCTKKCNEDCPKCCPDEMEHIGQQMGQLSMKSNRNPPGL